LPVARQGPVTIPGSIGFQVSTNFLDAGRTGVYFFVGGDVSAEQPSSDPLTLASVNLGAAVSRYGLRTCSLGDGVWGGGVGFFGLVSLGVDCNAKDELSGIGFPIRSKQFKERNAGWNIGAKSLTGFILGPGGAGWDKSERPQFGLKGSGGFNVVWPIAEGDDGKNASTLW